MDVLQFKEISEEKYAPIGDWATQAEVEQLVWEWAEYEIEQAAFDAEVLEVVLAGSRCRGLERPDSDLDVIVYYEGREREDDMFSLLNSSSHYIDDIEVDINPIRREETGNIEYYLGRVENYLAEKAAQ